MAKSLILQGFLASMTGFEPATPCSGAPPEAKKGGQSGSRKVPKVPILKEKQAIRSKSETSGKKVEKGPVVSKANIFKSSLPPILTGCWMFDF